MSDRVSGEVVGLPTVVHEFLGRALEVLEVGVPWQLEGYLPARMSRAAGQALLEGTDKLVVVCRPEPWKGPGLHPVEVHRREDAAQHLRKGEILSFYEVAFAPPMLRWAHFAALGSGYTTTTLRPPAPGTARSEVAMRTVLRGSHLLG